MALFKKKPPKPAPNDPQGQRGSSPNAPRGQQDEGVRPIMGQVAFCRICDGHRQFSRCWLRAAPVQRCSCCGLAFPDPRKLYQQDLPTCPKCGEYLECSGFQYGLCDGCGSKFELMPGTRPGLLPNKKQRAQMNTAGRSRSND